MKQLDSLLQEDARWRFYEDDQSRRTSIKKIEQFVTRQLRRVHAVRVLEVGCGSGVGPLVLQRFGYDAYGIDPHFRREINEIYPNLFYGDGKCLPFGDQSFDLTYSLEVIEHVGTTDGALSLSATFHEERLDFLKELCRVSTRYVLIATPNKLFPIDEHATDSNGRFGFRLHSPCERNTLSAKELCDAFARYGFRLESFVDPTGYYQYDRIQRKFGRWAVTVADVLVRSTSNKVLGGTPINPHLFMMFERR